MRGAGKGEHCLCQGRHFVNSGFRCRNDLYCAAGPDNEHFSGPGPGGLGGCFQGVGICIERRGIGERCHGIVFARPAFKHLSVPKAFASHHRAHHEVLGNVRHHSNVLQYLL